MPRQDDFNRLSYARSSVMCILTRVQPDAIDANFPVYWLQFNEIRAQIGRLCPLVNESNCTQTNFEDNCLPMPTEVARFWPSASGRPAPTPGAAGTCRQKIRLKPSASF